MKRTSVNPSDWGLAFKMDQAEISEGATRHLRCSGQVSLVPDEKAAMGVSVAHPEDMGGQIKSALGALDQILEKADMTRADIVQLRFFTTDVDAFLANYGVYAEWITPAGICPPQSVLGIGRLVMPELMIEIEMEAAS